jgi:hypothetical protein
MASRQHTDLAAKILGPSPNRKTRRFSEEFSAKSEIERRVTAAPSSAVYRMIGTYVPYQKWAQHSDIQKVEYKL